MFRYKVFNDSFMPLFWLHTILLGLWKFVAFVTLLIHSIIYRRRKKESDRRDEFAHRKKSSGFHNLILSQFSGTRNFSNFSFKKKVLNKNFSILWYFTSKLCLLAIWELSKTRICRERKERRKTLNFLFAWWISTTFSCFLLHVAWD